MELSGFCGQVAVVTGAFSGLSRAPAVELARLGATGVVNHPPRAGSREQAAAGVSEIGAAGGEAVATDVTREDQVEATMAETVQRFGTLHVLVANTGIERPAAIQDMALADWQAVIDVNLTMLSSRRHPRCGNLCGVDRYRKFQRPPGK
jgi:glucose 1-dehydrogenase